MRVYWWQGGLHAEPENEVETEALMVLLDGLKAGRPPDTIGGPPSTGEATADELAQGEGGLDVRP